MQLKKLLASKQRKELLPLQPGDVPDTFADVSDLEKFFDYKPSTEIEDGIRNFVDWYKGYYQ